MHICDDVLSGCFYSTDAQFSCMNTYAEVEAVIRTQQIRKVCGASGDPPMFMRQECPLWLWYFRVGCIQHYAYSMNFIIKRSHNIVASGPVSIDCVINRGHSRGYNVAWSIGRSPDIYVARMLSLSLGLLSWRYSTPPTQWILHIEGSHDIVEFKSVSIDCIINCGPYKGCNAAWSIGGSSDVYVVGVLTLSPEL